MLVYLLTVDTSIAPADTSVDPGLELPVACLHCVFFLVFIVLVSLDLVHYIIIIVINFVLQQ